MKPLFQEDSRVCAQPAQKNISCLFLSVCLAAVLSLSLPQAGYTCGLAWNMTPSHFDGVDDQGNVLLIQKLEEMESVQGHRLPLFAVFSSESGNRSPFVGYGWSVPLLESRIVQVEENRFCLYQPDGYQRMFGRDKVNANILKSQKLWMAEIRGDTITAQCKCGYKLVFRNGRLISMEVKEGKFDYVHEGGLVAEIREGIRTVLKVEKKPLTEDVSALTLLNGEKIGLERVKRPLVQVINNNRNMTDVTVKSLSKITLTDGTIQTFEYGVDKKLNPTLKLHDREIVWDAATGKVIRDGKWSYSITPGTDPRENAAIGRINAQNQKEFWHKNYAKGEEITEGLDGVRKIKTWFTSGKLRGRERKEVEIKDGVKKTVQELSYNEKGLLIRIRDEKNDTFLIYEDNGELAALVQNGKMIRNYTTNGAFLARQYVE